MRIKMKTLVLAEKPSVGRDIGRVLHCTPQGNGFFEGKDYIVTWGLGHLVTLKDPEGYDKKYKEWKMEELPIMPKKLETEVIRQTAKQFQTVKKLEVCGVKSALGLSRSHWYSDRMSKKS